MGARTYTLVDLLDKEASDPVLDPANLASRSIVAADHVVRDAATRKPASSRRRNTRLHVSKTLCDAPNLLDARGWNGEWEADRRKTEVDREMGVGVASGGYACSWT